MLMRRRAWVVASLALLAGAACRSGQHQPVDDETWPQLGPVPLYVRNDNFLDMNVSVQSHGMNRRIGTVSGNSSANFKLERSMISPDGFTLVATPIGGTGRATSGTLSVGVDQTVDFRIAPVLRQSSAVVR